MNLTNEAARVIGYLSALIVASVALLAAFGLDISEEQREAILGFMAALVPVIILTVEAIRSKVYSQASYDKVASNAYTQSGEPSPR